MRELSRRRFISLALLGSFAIASTPLFLKSPVKKYAAAVIRSKSYPLVIPDKVITKFLSDFEIYLVQEDELNRYSRFNIVRWLYHYFPDRNIASIHRILKKREEAVMKHFFLSTNILADKAVQSGEKMVEYRRFWHDRLACQNDFADFSLS